jgi:hypothetical protein
MLPALMRHSPISSPVLFLGASFPTALGSVARPTVWRYRGVGQGTEVIWHSTTYAGEFTQPVVVKSGNTRRIYSSIAGDIEGPYTPPTTHYWANYCYSDDNFETPPTIKFYLIKVSNSGQSKISLAPQLMTIPNSTSLRAFENLPFTYAPPATASPTYSRITISFSDSVSISEIGSQPGDYTARNIYCNSSPPYTFSRVDEYFAAPASPSTKTRVGNGNSNVVLSDSDSIPLGPNFAWDEKTGIGIIPLLGSTASRKPVLLFTGTTPSFQGSGGWPYTLGTGAKGNSLYVAAAGDGNFLGFCNEPSSPLAAGDVVGSSNATSWNIRKANAFSRPSWAGYCRTTKEFFFQSSGGVRVSADLGFSFDFKALNKNGGIADPQAQGFVE